MKKNLLFMVMGLICLVNMMNVSVAQSVNAFQQGSDPDHLVVMEAENFHENIPGTTFQYPATTGPFYTQNWTLKDTTAGFSGTGAMVTLPNVGYSTSDVLLVKANSPTLKFVVNFDTTGTHYIWLRANVNNSGGDRSIHAGLDDTISAVRMEHMTLKTWEWRSNISGGATRPRIFVKSKGEHTFCLYMRQDGMQIDKILLTTNPDYLTPGTTTGPAESGRVVNVSISPISNDYNKYSLNIYPNPGSGNIHLDFGSNKVEDVQINISNMIGQQFISKSLKSVPLTNGIDLSLQSLKNGIYLIQCKIAGQTQSLRFIKN
ncbi:MAG: T9SS type A sorting domain-containing protein [Bacteroidia bacterium]|nr:T9SS type A sorting domain-containing protein [Bacteroidia bacterium]